MVIGTRLTIRNYPSRSHLYCQFRFVASASPAAGTGNGVDPRGKDPGKPNGPWGSHHGPFGRIDLSVLRSDEGQHDTPDTAQWRTEIGWPIFRTTSG
jgi:hypothetical protein